MHKRSREIIFVDHKASYFIIKYYAYSSDYKLLGSMLISSIAQIV